MKARTGVIDWTERPSLFARLVYAWPCWLGGHKWMWQNALDDPEREFCMKCGEGRSMGASPLAPLASDQRSAPRGPKLPPQGTR